jgi:hypothetical protein
MEITEEIKTKELAMPYPLIQLTLREASTATKILFAWDLQTFSLPLYWLVGLHN